MTAPMIYVSFPGTAREALGFYCDVFGGEVALYTKGEFGSSDGPPDHIAHGVLNGVVSLACNVPVTTALAAAGLPILAANIVAIGTASVVNFVLSDRLVFTR